MKPGLDERRLHQIQHRHWSRLLSRGGGRPLHRYSGGRLFRPPRPARRAAARSSYRPAVRLVNYSLVHVWCPDRGVFAATGQPPGGPGRSGAVPRGARRRRALLAAGPPRSLRRCSPSREQRAGIGAVRYQEKGHKIAPVPVLSAFTTGSCISISAVIIIYHRQQRGLV
jgi:hypothetical protein